MQALLGDCQHMATRAYVYNMGRLLIVVGFVLSSALISSGSSAQSSEKPADQKLRINLLLSGGGTRAAAFAYGAMIELNRFCLDDDGSSPKKNVRLIPIDRSAQCPGKSRKLLTEINVISAVSGGSITAGYYMSHRPDEFLQEFPALLKEAKIERRLLLKERPWSLWKFIRPPMLLLTSAIDTITTALSIPLFFLPIHFELTPPATMVLTDGIIESGQLADVYDDLFFDGKTLGSLKQRTAFPFGSVVPLNATQPPHVTELLIHATDIANGRIFTFDEDTFACLGTAGTYSDFPLAVAAAASSSLPGVFAPMQLDDALGITTPLTADRDKCPLILNDKTRTPLLVDGGVSDNLGVGGILRKVFEEKRLNPAKRSEKDLLIIINAGTEAESSLPGLAGHMDNSFDALIRDKTDLSRLMASNLLDQFGFQAIEFKLSDIVTKPLELRLAAEFTERENRSDSTQPNTHKKLIEHGYALTEMERKVLDDLNQAGMIPSAEQIDTLIAAGRAVIRARFKDLENEWQIAREKQFSPLCQKINNFSKFFCWPEDFEHPHLASNRIGPLLRVITGTGGALRERATENRINLADSLKERYRDLLADEILNRWSLYTVGACQHFTKVLLKINESVDQDQQLYRLIGQTNIMDKTNWDRALKEINDHVTNSCPSSEDPTKMTEELVKNNAQKLAAKLIDLLDKMNKPPTDVPQYYLLQASLANFLGLDERTRHFLSTGTYKFPNHPELQRRAGWMLLLAQNDFKNGIEHLRRGHWLIRQTNFALKTRQSIGTTLGEKSRLDDLSREYEKSEARIKLSLSFALATTPLPQKDKGRYVSDQQVHEWEMTHLPSVHRQSLLDLVTHPEDYEEDFQPIECALEERSDTFSSKVWPFRKHEGQQNSKSSCAWLNQVALEHRNLRDNLNKLIHETNFYFLCPKFQAGCAPEEQKQHLSKLSDLASQLRVQIRDELAKDANIVGDIATDGHGFRGIS
ncbi:MAG: patatin-like phospholipase family protein, partial [Nitrospira defluvii]|nr:patatin-like phospholipase family protein [Nitrospira defluvii]